MTECELNDPVTIDPLALAPEDRAWVEATLDTLSVEGKVGQLFALSSIGDDLAEISRHCALGVGGIHRFPGHDLKAAWEATRAAIQESRIPPLISGDIEGGTVSQAFATAVPNQMGLAACADEDLSRRISAIVLREARRQGFNWTFSPVVDINRNFRNPVVGTRSYGSDMATILREAGIMTEVLQAGGIATCAKHWPGDGIDDRDQHLVTSVNGLSMDAWHASFGEIYRTMFAKGVMSVMSAHIALPAAFPADAGAGRFVPASVSKRLNLELLRGELGFKGLIVSDATPMGGLTGWQERAEAVPAVIENGCDMFLFSPDPGGDYRHMMDGLRRGALSEQRLEDAVRMILTLKARLGLHRMTLDEWVPPLEEGTTRLSTPESEAVAAEANARAITLVKDTQDLLPLDPARHRRVVLLAEEGWNFISGALPRSLDVFCEDMRKAGFELRMYDAETPPAPEDTDLVVYLIGQEATASLSHIYLDWTALHGGARKAMKRFSREIPTLMISLGQPYYLYDAPDLRTYINGYSALPSVQSALVERLLGKAPFTGVSPVDPFCGEEQLRY
ncbi:MAG: glycoside hydrolase family 3 N-terminal domain-containing protein [Pseudomonadota bacterium]|nr:glycoside hydrolase family 3 N-terminal domain-containing protein [Pseudomonadota bacterium]